MSRTVLAFLPQHTTTKSRVMAIVDKGSGEEIDAVATVGWPHEAIALCNILNSSESGLENLSGLWASLPASVRASLERARDERAGDDDRRSGLASLFVADLEVPDLPDPEAAVDWAVLFPAVACPAEGCEGCEGCPAHAKDAATVGSDSDSDSGSACGPGGSCSCATAELGEDDEPCVCQTYVVGPRWAVAIYQSLAEIAHLLVDHALDLMWGVEGPSSSFPSSFVAQPPGFFLRLAKACADLCAELARGAEPIPHTIAEQVMLDEAARSYIDAFIGGDGLDVESMKRDLQHLPEAYGDFDMDALWMFQISDTDWFELTESEKIFDPGSIDRVFDVLPEAAQWPRSGEPAS